MSTRHALLSVSDKTGIAELGRGLADAGFTLLSTGGTARALREAGLDVVDVSAHTGHAEIMNGRVKTLHPRVHGGILGLRDAHADEAAQLNIPWIDVVACNLYPFERTVSAGEVTRADAVENIDIGGPSMIRSAAKNHADVVVLVDPDDYATVLSELGPEGQVSLERRRALALKAFQHTASYDAIIAEWLGRQEPRPDLPADGARAQRLHAALRYGENPHQKAGFYADPLPTGRSLARVTQLQGKHLSFNNLADLDGALRAVFELDEPGCVVVKHMNPCGAATHADGMAAAFELALSADPVSAFGGIVAFNRPVDADAIRALRRSRTFFEVVAAPGFSDEAKELMAPRAKIRLMELPSDWIDCRPAGTDARRVQGGWLFQDWDVDAPVGWTVASERAPDADEEAALRFAWRVCRSVKSNAIVLARAHGGGMVLNGVGAGQMSRVDAVRLAISKATRPVAGSVLASDAFFPFADGVFHALAAGVRAIVQPGGSIRDAAVVRAVDAAEGAMVVTGMRHFRH
jgi:phosphoribosylaminoimidazolecarboxamide formyltransferase / IMP cyclohydrolase